jgi:hypothetical protein
LDHHGEPVPVLFVTHAVREAEAVHVTPQHEGLP